MPPCEGYVVDYEWDEIVISDSTDIRAMEWFYVISRALCAQGYYGHNYTVEFELAGQVNKRVVNINYFHLV